MAKNKRKKNKVSNAQRRAIRANYARIAQENKQNKKQMPTKFPFWARLRFEKYRTTLVIDEDMVYDKQKKQMTEGYVHREATSSENKNYERIHPNPDRSRTEDMYLKRPRKTPKYLFEPHNKDLDMPDSLRERYDKNNHKNKEN